MEFNKDMTRQIVSRIGNPQVNLNNSDFVESGQRDAIQQPGRWGQLARTSSGDQVFRPNHHQCTSREDYLKIAEAIKAQVDENLPPKDDPEVKAMLEESKSLAIERETGGWLSLNQDRIEQFPPKLEGYRSEEIIAKAGENELMKSHMENKAKGGYKPKMPFTHGTMDLDYAIMLVEGSKFEVHDDHVSSRANVQGNLSRRQPMSRVEVIPNVQKDRNETSRSQFDCRYGASNWPTLPDQSTKKVGGSNGLGGGSNFNNHPNRNGKSGRWASSSVDENFPTRGRPENGNGIRSRNQQNKIRPNWSKKFFEGIQRAIDEGNQDFVAGPVHPCQVQNGNELEKKSRVHDFSEKSSSGSAPSRSNEGSTTDDDDESSEPDLSSSQPNSSDETVVHNSSEAIPSSIVFQNELQETIASTPEFQQAPVNEAAQVSDTPAPKQIFDSHHDQEDLSSQNLIENLQVDSAIFVDQVNPAAGKTSQLENDDATECKPTNIEDPTSDLMIYQLRNKRHSGQLSPELVEFACDIVDKCLEEARQKVASIMQQDQCISRVDQKESVVVDPEPELLINSVDSAAVASDYVVDEKNGLEDSTESGKALSVADDDDNSCTITETADKSELLISESEQQKSESVDENVPASDLRQQDDPDHESHAVTSQAHQSCDIGPETKTDENIEHMKSIGPAYVVVAAEAENNRLSPLDSVSSAVTSGEATPGPLPTISAPDVQTVAVEGLGNVQLVDTVSPSAIEAAASPTLTATETARILSTDEDNCQSQIVANLKQKESAVEEKMKVKQVDEEIKVKEVEAAASSNAKGDTKKPKACLQQ